MDTEIISFNVDLTAPNLEITSPLNGGKVYSNSITIEWSGSDSGSGILGYEIRIDQGSWIDLGVVYSYTFTSLDDGEHLVDIRASDKAGNLEMASLSFEVDASKPMSLTTDVLGAFIILSVIIIIPTVYMLGMRRRRL
jgi:hypothetical protein